MEHIGEITKEIEGTIILHGADPITRHGFTQVPNFILKHPRLSFGAKVAYSMFLSYAWHKDYVFPGQKRLAEDMGIKERQIRNFISELKKENLLSVERRGLGKTNIYNLYLVVDMSKKSR